MFTIYFETVRTSVYQHWCILLRCSKGNINCAVDSFLLSAKYSILFLEHFWLKVRGGYLIPKYIYYYFLLISLFLLWYIWTHGIQSKLKSKHQRSCLWLEIIAHSHLAKRMELLNFNSHYIKFHGRRGVEACPIQRDTSLWPRHYNAPRRFICWCEIGFNNCFLLCLFFSLKMSSRHFVNYQFSDICAALDLNICWIT